LRIVHALFPIALCLNPLSASKPSGLPPTQNHTLSSRSKEPVENSEIACLIDYTDSINKSHFSNYKQAKDFNHIQPGVMSIGENQHIAVYAIKNNKLLLFQTTTKKWKWITASDDFTIKSIESIIDSRLKSHPSSLPQSNKTTEWDLRLEFILGPECGGLFLKPGDAASQAEPPASWNQSRILVACKRDGDWLEVFPVNITGETGGSKHAAVSDNWWQYGTPVSDHSYWVRWQKPGTSRGSKIRLIRLFNRSINGA